MDGSQPAQQPAAGKPGGRKSGHVNHRAYRKRKAQEYLLRSTCVTCRVVFRSPKKRSAHVESGHKSTVGANTKRVYKTSF
jgi:uncharacterized C2H2 Zn-finger protein